MNSPFGKNGSIMVLVVLLFAKSHISVSTFFISDKGLKNNVFEIQNAALVEVLVNITYVLSLVTPPMIIV